MTQDEFEFNKDLLKEIASKKGELRETLRMTTQGQIDKFNSIPKPTYEIFNL